MSAKCRADVDIKAGVGIPSGVMGTPWMDLHIPNSNNSASAGGVKSVKSGFAPAADKPGIFPVSVVAIVQMKSGFFPVISSRNASPFGALQASSTSRLCFMAHLTFYFDLTA